MAGEVDARVAELERDVRAAGTAVEPDVRAVGAQDVKGAGAVGRTGLRVVADPAAAAVSGDEDEEAAAEASRVVAEGDRVAGTDG